MIIFYVVRNSLKKLLKRIDNILVVKFLQISKTKLRKEHKNKPVTKTVSLLKVKKETKVK